MRNKLIIFFFLSALLFVQTQVNLPANPCPHLFQYTFDGSSYYGTLQINNPNTGNIKLIVKLSVPGAVTSYGSIALLYSRQQTLQNLMQNRPVYYRITFPPGNYVPRLTEINVNGQVLCNGPAESGYSTNLNLDHVLKTQVVNLNNPSTAQSVSSPQPLNTATQYYQQQQQPSAVPPRQSVATPSADQSIESICGTISVQTIPLAIGGESITPGSWPWLTAIFVHDGNNYNYQCGGTLLTSKIVISAAHCFKQNNKLVTAERTLIVLGRHNIHNWAEPSSVNRQVREIKVHDEYRSDTSSFDADISVIVLFESVIFSSHIRPACLWPSTSNIQQIVGHEGTVVGWGFDQNKRVTPEPSKIRARVVNEVECLRSNAAFREITSHRTFCAGNRDGKGPCRGDSGSGIFMQLNGRWYVRGSVSGSLEDQTTVCNLREYFVYSDAAQFFSWITTYTQTYR